MHADADRQFDRSYRAQDAGPERNECADCLKRLAPTDKHVLMDRLRNPDNSKGCWTLRTILARSGGLPSVFHSCIVETCADGCKP